MEPSNAKRDATWEAQGLPPEVTPASSSELQAEPMPFHLRGAMRCDGVGALHCAEDRKSGSRVAIRWLPRREAPTRSLEFDFLARLPIHAALPRIRAMGQTPTAAYVAIDFPQGRLLSAMAPPRFELQALRRMGSELAGGLAALHGAKLVHGELAPGSVLVSEQGSALLWDAPLLLINRSTDRRGESREMAALPTTGAFLPPERARGGTPTAEGDIYSLAAVLCFAGGMQLPSFPSTLELLHRVATATWAPTIPAVFTGPTRQILERMLSPVPALRPTAEEVHALLVPPADRPPRRSGEPFPFFTEEVDIDALLTGLGPSEAGASTARVTKSTVSVREEERHPAPASLTTESAPSEDASIRTTWPGSGVDPTDLARTDSTEMPELESPTEALRVDRPSLVTPRIEQLVADELEPQATPTTDPEDGIATEALKGSAVLVQALADANERERAQAGTSTPSFARVDREEPRSQDPLETMPLDLRTQTELLAEQDAQELTEERPLFASAQGSQTNAWVTLRRVWRKATAWASASNARLVVLGAFASILSLAALALFFAWVDRRAEAELRSGGRDTVIEHEEKAFWDRFGSTEANAGRKSR